MLLYNKFFAEDTPHTNNKARKIVLGIYSALVLLGVAIIAMNVISGEMNYKMISQSLILLVVGAGGYWVTISAGEKQKEK